MIPIDNVGTSIVIEGVNKLSTIIIQSVLLTESLCSTKNVHRPKP